MKKVIAISLVSLCFVGCRHKEPMEVTSNETRPLSTRDGEIKLDATSAERFGVTQQTSASVTFVDAAPSDWKSQPATMFRLKNYSFGTAGEVSLSQSQGTVLDNANRWLGQFEAEKLYDESLTKLPTETFLGTQAAWIEAQGTYNPGMGKSAASGYALAGVIAEVNGSIVTVKMVGPVAEVEAQKQALRAYLASVKSAE